MSYHIVSNSMEDIHQDVLTYLVDEAPFESAPRGKPIREAIGASFELIDPRNRLIMSPARAVNYGFGVGELCWYIRGDNDLETMLYYNRRMAQFSDDGRTINSAYGHRMFDARFVGLRFTGNGKEMEDHSQLDNVIEELRRDPDSRRAVMHINEPTDLNKAAWSGSKDVPCTMSLQLLIRNRRLHMVVEMRSNDVIWGMPYDVFSFTCLQEAFLYRLQEEGVGVDDLGSYHHRAGSLHIYDTHYDLAREVSRELIGSAGPMAPFDVERLRTLAETDEPLVRTDAWPDLVMSPSPAPEVDSIGWMFHQLTAHKNKRITEARNKEMNVEQQT